MLFARGGTQRRRPLLKRWGCGADTGLRALWAGLTMWTGRATHLLGQQMLLQGEIHCGWMCKGSSMVVSGGLGHAHGAVKAHLQRGGKTGWQMRDVLSAACAGRALSGVIKATSS